jgi:hypothetical protein
MRKRRELKIRIGARNLFIALPPRNEPWQPSKSQDQPALIL